MQMCPKHRNSPLESSIQHLIPLPHTLLSDSLIQKVDWFGWQVHQLIWRNDKLMPCKPSSTFHLSLLSLSIQFLWQHFNSFSETTDSTLYVSIAMSGSPSLPPNTHPVGEHAVGIHDSVPLTPPTASPDDKHTEKIRSTFFPAPQSSS